MESKPLQTLKKPTEQDFPEGRIVTSAYLLTCFSANAKQPLVESSDVEVVRRSDSRMNFTLEHTMESDFVSGNNSISSRKILERDRRVKNFSQNESADGSPDTWSQSKVVSGVLICEERHHTGHNSQSTCLFRIRSIQLRRGNKSSPLPNGPSIRIRFRVGLAF